MASNKTRVAPTSVGKALLVTVALVSVAGPTPVPKITIFSPGETAPVE
jgi:hypothetical protein